MAINLSKGGQVNLQKEVPNLKKIGVGLGWEENPNSSEAEFDLDASVFMVNKKEKTLNDYYFVFYNNLNSQDGSTVHYGDNRTGDGDGDDESIMIDLSKVHPAVEEFIFVVTIDEAFSRRQNFGQVKNAFIRIYDFETLRDIAIYDLEENFSTATAIEFGRLYKKDNSWRFKTVGLGYNFELQGFVDKYTGV